MSTESPAVDPAAQAPPVDPPRRPRWWPALALGLLAAAGWAGSRWLQDREIEAAAGRARRLVAEGKLAEALPDLGQWLRGRPDSGEAYLLAARAAFVLGKAEDGLQALGRAEALGYDPIQVDRERGLALVAMGRPGEAVPVLSRVRTGLATPDPQVLQALARAEMATFQLKAAREVVDAWVAAEPESVDAYLARVEVGRRTNVSTEEIAADFERVLARAPDNRAALLGLAEVRMTAGAYAEAEGLFARLVAFDPSGFEAVLGLGLARERLNRDAEALASLERAASLAPSDPRPIVAQGRIEARLGHLDRALEWLNRAVGLDPHDVEARHQRAGVLARLGRPTEAATDREEATRLRADQDKLSQLMITLLEAPRDVQFRWEAARWLFDHGHAPEAIRWTELILKDDPGHRPTHRMLADHFQQAGQQGLANYHRLQAGPPDTSTTAP